MEKILILGGTGFVGRILTEELIKAGTPPVLFNRGKRNAGIFPGLRKITGDRLTNDINQIAGESWDTVIDFSCMFPDNLDDVTGMLNGKVGRYIFISTASVYPMDDPEKWKSPLKEDAETLSCTPEQRKDTDVMATYGQKKAECERVLFAKDRLDSVIFRPALIYGRYDLTDRFYYWLWRVHTQDKILFPGGGKDKLTNTYSEDFAKLIQSAIDIKNHNKVYNAVTHSPVSIKEYLDIASRLLGQSPKFINTGAEFLDEHKVQPWADLPMWLGGMNLVLDNSKALRDFPVKFHSFEDSVKGCIDYYSALGWKEPEYGISPAKEKDLIKKIS